MKSMLNRSAYKIFKITAPGMILAGLIIFSALEGSAASEYDPAYRWRTIKTANFRIHYHDANYSTAVKTAALAEKHYGPMTAAAGWKPWSPTHIVLVDSTDQANGYATPFPRNKIQIYMTSPAPDSTIGNYDDWLEMVFIHEFTHILNIDTVSGIPKTSRYLTGRCLFPNIFAPIWILEGSAVHQESLLTGYGRNNSAHTDMVLRGDVKDNRFKAISEASVFPREWPGGSVPYLYGGAFVRYLEEKKKAGGLAAYFHENGDNIIPYSDYIYPLYYFNKDAKDIYGVSFYDLWQEWEAAAKLKYQTQLDRINEMPLTGTEKISDPKVNSVMPLFSEDGKQIFYVESPRRETPGVKAYDLTSGKSQLLFNVHNPSALTLYKDGSLLAADLEVYRSFSWFYEFFIFDGSSYEQKTSGVRAPYVTWSKGADLLAYITLKAGKYSLQVRDSAGKDRFLIKDTLTHLTFPALSPDGKTLALTIKRGPGSDIALISTDGGPLTIVTGGRGHSLQPVWHPEGDRIIFSSDMDGVFNLYEYSLAEAKVIRLTNLTGGAFSPALSPDGKQIVFADYTSRGHVISLMEYPSAGLKIEDADRPLIFEPVYEKDETSGLSQKNPDDSPYSSLSTLAPVLYIPLITSEEIYHKKYDSRLGLILFGTDALTRHSYQAMVTAYMESKRATIDASYTYSGLYPDISLGYYDDTLFYGDDKFPWPEDNAYKTERNLSRTFYLAIDIPWIHFNSDKYLGFYGASSKKITDTWQGGPVYRETEREGRLGGYASYTALDFYRYSLIPQGRALTLSWDGVIDSLEGLVNYYVAAADYAEYISVAGPGEGAVLKAGARGGFAYNNIDFSEPFSLGRFTRGSAGFIDGSWGIRGYPGGAVTGYNFASALLEYNIPLLQTDFGASLFPMIFRDLWTVVFAEAGSVWNGIIKANDIRYSGGLELRTRFTAGYRADIELFGGWARGFSSLGEDQFYFGIGTIFEGALKQRRPGRQF